MRPHTSRLICPVLALAALLCGPARAETADGAQAAFPAPDASAPVAFDIPALPLVDALKRYASLTRQPTLFRSEIVAGQTSSPVQGLHLPGDALRLLLDGTGLVAEKVDTGPASAFVLRTVGAPVAAPRADLESVAGRAGDADYPGLVQATVWDALCGDARTAPGVYRSVLRFRLDAAGQVQRARLLGSTGDPRRDAAVLEILQRVRMERAPPPGMPQPLTLLVLPREAGGAQRCNTNTNINAAPSP